MVRATWEACSGNLEEKWEPSQHLRLGPRFSWFSWMCCFKVSFIGYKLKILSKVAEMALLLLHDRCPVSGLAEAPSLLSWGFMCNFQLPSKSCPVQFIIHQTSFHLMLYTLVLFVGIPSLHLNYKKTYHYAPSQLYSTHTILHVIMR